MALARKHRLSKKDLENVFKQGKTVKSSFLFIKFLKNDIGRLRTAAVVSKKILKKAVLRNRLRRLIAETIRSGHFLEGSFDIVVIANTSIVGKPTEEINRALEQTIKKVFSQ